MQQEITFLKSSAEIYTFTPIDPKALCNLYIIAVYEKQNKLSLKWNIPSV